MQTDKDILARLAEHYASLNLLAEAIGVEWATLKNWRLYRDIPPTWRPRIYELCRKHKVRVSFSWIGRPATVTNGATNGRASKGKQQAQARRKARKETRRRPQQQRRSAGHSRRGAAAPPASD